MILRHPALRVMVSVWRITERKSVLLQLNPYFFIISWKSILASIGLEAVSLVHATHPLHRVKQAFHHSWHTTWKGAFWKLKTHSLVLRAFSCSRSYEGTDSKSFCSLLCPQALLFDLGPGSDLSSASFLSEIAAMSHSTVMKTNTVTQTEPKRTMYLSQRRRWMSTRSTLKSVS